MERKHAYKLGIKVMIVDSSENFRSTIINALSGSNNIDIVASLPDADEARKKIRSIKHQLNVAIVEISPSRPENAAFIRELADQYFIPSIAMYDANMRLTDNILAADALKKPSSPSETVTFCTLMGTKIILAAKLSASQPITSETGNTISPILSPAGSRKSKVAPILPTREDIAGLDRKAKDGYVVALGASTGGTDALECIISSFPSTMPPIVVVQHMPPVFTKLYSERLNKCCAVTVREASNGDRVVQGQCLIAAGGFHMELKKDAKGYYVKCEQREKVSGHCPSVDVLFSSVAETAGRKAIGALMTGMGADGAKGLLKMHNSGAYTIGQDKESCIVYGMPMEAYKLGACSEQQPLNNIGKTLCRRLTDGWN